MDLFILPKNNTPTNVFNSMQVTEPISFQNFSWISKILKICKQRNIRFIFDLQKCVAMPTCQLEQSFPTPFANTLQKRLECIIQYLSMVARSTTKQLMNVGISYNLPHFLMNNTIRSCCSSPQGLEISAAFPIFNNTRVTFQFWTRSSIGQSVLTKMEKPPHKSKGKFVHVPWHVCVPGCLLL